MATAEGMIRECAEEAFKQLETAYPEHIESLVKGSEMWDSIWRAKQMVQTIIDTLNDKDADEWYTDVKVSCRKYYGQNYVGEEE